MARRAAVIIEAIDRASPVFRSVRGNLQTLGGIAAAVGVYQFGRLFKNGLEAAVAASAQQERAESKLAVALANTGQSVRNTLPGLKAYASELQRATGVGDELILENQQILVSLGKLRGEGLQRATKAALDLSASGVDLKTAFELVGKAAAGETGTLSRYGIILSSSIPKSEKFEAALGMIEERFGGQAVARMRTYEGQVEAVAGKFGDLAETIGGPLREVGTTFLSDWLGPLVDELQGAATEAEGFRESVFNLSITLAAALEPIEITLRNLRRFSEIPQPDPFKFLTDPLGFIGDTTLALNDLTREIDLFAPATNRLKQALRESFAEGGKQPGTEAQEALAAARAELEAFILSFTRIPIELEAIGIGLLDQKDLIGLSEEEVIRLRDSWAITEEATKNATAAALELGLAIENEVEPPVLTLGRTIDNVIREKGVNAALAFGDTLVDAAFGAKVAWGDFFRQLLADLAKAIVQALILRAITGFATGGAGFLFSARGGGVPGGAPVRAAAGFTVPGPPNRGDVVPALLRPGELVLNRDQQRELRGGAGGPITVRVELGPNLRTFADALTVEVERGGARLVASELVRPIRNRRA